MAKVSPVKVKVEREEGGAAQSKQKGDDMFIFHPLPAYFMPDLANRDAPAFQKLSLTLTNVLVQNVQAATRSNTYSGAVYSLA